MFISGIAEKIQTVGFLSYLLIGRFHSVFPDTKINFPNCIFYCGNSELRLWVRTCRFTEPHHFIILQLRYCLLFLHFLKQVVRSCRQNSFYVNNRI